MQTIIKEFCAAIDIDRSKVKNGPLKITLFGGKTSNSDGSLLSQRGTFLLCTPTLADAFVVPEDYKNWNHFGTYNDLLSFEEDVCSIVDCVIVFLETEGAIAELGCLIKHIDIAPKLFVVVRNKYYEEPSFIKLGILQYLENVYSDNILVSHDATLNTYEREAIVEAIHARTNAAPHRESFRKPNIRHVLYLIVDFIELLQVARITDIQALLQHLEIPVTKVRLEQLLLALKNVGLINEQRVLRERCFLVATANLPGIEYSFRSPSAKRISWKAKIFEKTTADKWRKYAFQTLKQSKDEKERQQCP